MDLENEIGEETRSSTTEQGSENEILQQELVAVKEFTEPLNPTDVDIKTKVISDESSLSPSTHRSQTSLVLNEEFCGERDTDSLQKNENEMKYAGASPHCSNSDESQKEISLVDVVASEVKDDSNLSTSNDNLVDSGDVSETNGRGEKSQEKDVSVSSSHEEIGTTESFVQEACDDTEVINKITEERDSVTGGDVESISVEQEKLEGETKLSSVTEKTVESCEKEDAPPETIEEKGSPSGLEEKTVRDDSENKDNDEGEGKVSSTVSVIDTSIFPKPPRESDSVFVANCFELDVIPKADSHNEFDQSPGFEMGDIETSADSKSAYPGPSDDREDISDEELDLESNAQHISHGSLESNPIQPSISSVNPNGGFDSESFVNKSDNISMNSSDVGDIIDLKLEDAALKSIGSSCDKVSNEDLEAVSDDELPNAPHLSDIVSKQPTSTSLLDDREEVSSSEDEMDKPQNLDATPISSEDEFPSHNEDEASTVNPEKGFVASAQDADSHSRLESLEAEPISDEEDNNVVSDEPAKQENSFDDGEAGEIKSPALGSPISEQGDLMLGEVEPVSADESPDTDGELPSGDENDKGGDKGNHDKKFESIDSDEEIPGDNQRRDQSSGKNKKDESEVNKSSCDKGEYMETISDEENLDCEDSNKKEGKSSPVSTVVRSEEGQSQVEKGHIPTSFNEHQVELDYEEGYGEDGGGDSKAESKDDEARSESKPTEGEDGECADQDQGLASDKDEGELSDDDCEEGEIKEPGQRKMFVKPICRFFQRGHCTWGVSCRFLHPGVNDKGNYQMIEVPGFKPVGIHARLGIPGQYPEQQQPPAQEEVELPPPPMPDVPHVETAWERGLRIAKEQRKKASERKEKEPDFEEKRLNLSVEEDRELNKENERTPRIIPKEPYYDQQAYEVDEYYKIPRDPWHTGHYENFEVRYHHQQNSYSPPYREKPPSAPPMRYTRPLSPPIDKFGRHREDRPEPPERPHEPMRVSDYPPPVTKHPDEWIDPWRRSKSPKQRKPRSRSRGRRTRRSLSDSSDSSRSSRSSSGSSRSSRSGSSSSSSRSRSPEPAPPGVDRMDRHERYGGDQPRSMVSVRGPDGRGGGSGGGYNRYNNNNNNDFRYGRGNQGFSNNNNRGGSNAFGGSSRNPYNPRQDSYQVGRGGGGGGGGPAPYNNYRGGYGHRGGYNNRDPRGRYGGGRNMSPTRGGRGPTPDRPLPYARPRPKSRSSSRSSSSRSRSRSRSKSSDSSQSRSSSNSSRSSSSSSSSGGSADSDHLYRDLGSPSKMGRHPASTKKRPGPDTRKDSRNIKSNHHTSSSQSSSRHPPPPSGIDNRVPHPRSPPHSRSGGGDPKYSQIPLPPPSSSMSRSDSKYASRNAPQPPVKAKDPLKVVGQKSNIKLTLLPKQQQQSNLGDRPNPLASPPHKRRMSDRDLSPPSPPPTKRPNLSMQASSLRMAADKATKLQMRSDKAKSPPPGSLPPPSSSSASSSSFAQRSKNPLPSTPTPQKQLAGKSRPSGESVSSKPATKAPSGGSAPSSNPAGAKSKKSMSSRREELLKQLKAVEDAIARKKFKMS